MSDTPPPGRQLTELERQTFHRLGLTEGHWAALAPLPLFYRQGIRCPNRRTAGDLEATHRLRRALRTLEGLSAEAGHFWDRLGDGSRRPEAALATRLFAWHLATDVSFNRRVGVFQLLSQAAEHFAAPSPYNPRPPDPVIAFRRVVDAYLPCPAFNPAGELPRIPVEPPAPGVLDALAPTIRWTPPTHWPTMSTHDVPRLMPWLARALGEPVRDWWGAADPARFAADRGLASLAFEDRQRYFTAVFSEWTRALEVPYSFAVAKEQAQRFVFRMREWVDAVRFATRTPPPLQELLPADDPAFALALGVSLSPPAVAPPPPPAVRPIEAEFVRLPPALREVPPPKPIPPKPVEKPRPERVTATVAEPFPAVAFDAALVRARAVGVADVCAWIDSAPHLLFDDCRDAAARAVAVVKTENAVPPELWIIGDLHADLLTLANVIALAESRATPDRPAHFLFLGDFVDRGVHDHEALLLLFRLIMDHPERVCVVPGNHDVDLQFDEAAGRFKVTIEPAEYCVGLNAALARGTPGDRERVELARAFIRFCAGRPRAVFLPDGTLLTHGGFPHTDAQKAIAALPDLCNSRCQDDFLWARIAETARVKRPNRGSRGHEFGWDTLVQFAKLVEEKLELPVRRLVRGHDHVPDRWQEYSEYADNGVPVLTLNAMGRALDGEPARRDGKRHPLPAVGRFAANRLPDVVLVPLDPAEVERAFSVPEARAISDADEAGAVTPNSETTEPLREAVEEPPGGEPGRGAEGGS